MKRLILGITATTMTAFLALTACETSPKDGGLLPDARNAVAHAEADPNVLKYAPTELDRARKLLVNAESSAKAKGASDTVASHYAYLATQMARIAEQRAHEQLAMATSQMASARAVADRAQEQMDIIAARDVVLVALAGQSPAPSATGRVYWSPSRGLAFAASNLPPLAEGRVYQLWLVTSGAPVSAALITPDANGAARALVPGAGAIEPKAFAVTIEPAGGVPAPTGAMYLLGSM